MHVPPLSLRLEQRRPAVVLDPELVLGPGPLGLLLTRSLCRTMELWQVSELWQILDNSCRWREDTEALLPGRPVELVRGALDVCERWRAETDPAGLGCYYLGDQGSDSFLPEDADQTLPQRWRLLAQAFERRAQGFPLDQPLAAAWRDAAALAAALASAPILTLAPPAGKPAIGAALEAWQIIGLEEAPHDALLAREREFLRELCAAAGAAKLIWAGLGLAVLHLVVPGAACLVMPAGDESDVALRWILPLGDDPWDGAQAFWYRL